MDTKHEVHDAGSLVLDVRAVSRLLGCSTRHVQNLKTTGRMPEPLRIGRSVRWRTADIELWVRLGCPPREQFDPRKNEGVAI